MPFLPVAPGTLGQLNVVGGDDDDSTGDDVNGWKSQTMISNNLQSRFTIEA